MIDILRLRKVIDPRIKVLSDVSKLIDYFYVFNENYDSQLLTKYVEHEIVVMILKDVLHNYLFVESCLKSWAEKLQIKRGHVYWSVRIAVTGKTVALPLFESIEVLGEEEFKRRINVALMKLNNNS